MAGKASEQGIRLHGWTAPRSLFDRVFRMLLTSSTRCLQMPLWPFLAAVALFGTWSGPQHMTLESHPETGRRSALAAMSRPAANMLGHEPEPLA